MKEILSYLLIAGVVIPPLITLSYGFVKLVKSDDYIDYVWSGVVTFICCSVGLVYNII